VSDTVPSSPIGHSLTGSHQATGLLGWSWTSRPLRWLAGPDHDGTDAARRQLAGVELLDDRHLEHRLIRTPPGENRQVSGPLPALEELPGNEHALDMVGAS
jgi:hypothetical protein